MGLSYSKLTDLSKTVHKLKKRTRKVEVKVKKLEKKSKRIRWVKMNLAFNAYLQFCQHISESWRKDLPGWPRG